MIAPLAYMTAALLVRAMPAPAADAFARTLARLAFALGVPARRRLEANLRRMLAKTGAGSGPVATHEVRECARRSFEHFALSIADLVRLSRMDRAAIAGTVEVRGREHLAAALDSRRGVIVLSAHTGNWEWGAAFLAGAGARLHVAARPHASRWVDAWFVAIRRRFGVESLSRRPLWLPAARALRQGHWIGLMGDRPAAGAGSSLCGWAAMLARRTGAVILPVVMLRRPEGGYAACFEEPLTPERCLDGGYRAAMLRHLERVPEQWFAFEPVPGGLAG